MKAYNTVVKTISGETIGQAASLIKKGELVAFPTETVYGLGANAYDEGAVHKIFEAKGRPGDNPLIAHIADLAGLDGVACDVSEQAFSLARTYWPGPLSIVLKKSPRVPYAVTAGLDTVAVRMPAHEGARRLIRACALPVAAPSANLSGLPSPTKAAHVFADMRGKIPMILDGGPCRFGVESTVVDMSGEIPVLLRPGAVTVEMIREVCGACSVSSGVLRSLEEGEIVRSPGLKHRHYAPANARVILLEGEENALADYLNRFAQKDTHRCAVLAKSGLAGRVNGVETVDMGDDVSYTAGLFDTLRRLDEQGYEIVLCQAVSEQGIGLALMNRLLRASGFYREYIK